MTSAVESDEESLENLVASEADARDPEDPAQRPVSPWVLVAVSVAAHAVLLQPGPRTPGPRHAPVFALEPVAWMGRALHLGQPGFQFGQVINQTSGYLFPIGPFFTVASWLHIPTWWAQRLWIGFVFIAAFSADLSDSLRPCPSAPAGRG